MPDFGLPGFGDLPADLSGHRCAWCRRRAPERLGQGEICEVCIGLCAFAFLHDQRAAEHLYGRSLSWVEQAFAFQYANRLTREKDLCWWCARLGYDTAHTSSSPDCLYVAPTLCRVCDGLFIPERPFPAGSMLKAQAAYDELCRLVAG